MKGEKEKRQYIEEKGNKLIVKKAYENNNDGSYWIIVSFNSNSTETIHSRTMSMQLFVKGGEIVNRTITIQELPYILSVSSHKYIGDVYEDASRIQINYKNENAINEKERNKHDEIELDNFTLNEKGENVRNILTKEKEQEAVKSLLEMNNIFIDTNALIKLFQVDLDYIKRLAKEEEEKETDYLHYKEFEDSINKVFASKRTLIIAHYTKK